jgi:hypothetical protein
MSDTEDDEYDVYWDGSKRVKRNKRWFDAPDLGKEQLLMEYPSCEDLAPLLDLLRESGDRETATKLLACYAQGSEISTVVPRGILAIALRHVHDAKAAETFAQFRKLKRKRTE